MGEALKIPHPEHLSKDDYSDTILGNLKKAGLGELVHRFAQDIGSMPYNPDKIGRDQTELTSHELASQWLEHAVNFIGHEHAKQDPVFYRISAERVNNTMKSTEDLNLRYFEPEKMALLMFLKGLGGVEGVDDQHLLEKLNQPITGPSTDYFVTKNPVMEIKIERDRDNFNFELGAVD